MTTLSNFVLTKVKGTRPLDFEFFAEVDVSTTSGILWWKKTVTRRREIRREYAGSWHFTEDGTFTPGFEAERLERAWEAKHGRIQDGVGI